MSLSNICNRKSAKILLTLTVVLVASQYLFNAFMVTRSPVSFINLIGFSGNASIVYVQRRLSAGNLSGRVVTTAAPVRELCPVIPPTLVGHVLVNVQIPSWAYLEEENQRLEPGGRYRPPDCAARSRVAVIIPYRDRELHLKIFLQNIHPFLQRQQLEYGIYVVELAPSVKFNRALLMNVGFVEALRRHDYQCFIFHDVDLLPEDDRNLYTCPQTPRHLSVAIDRLHYKLPYAQLFGGVSAITKEHFQRINGFSNLYFGWGGEDDDMYRRILYSNLTVTRYSPRVARYKMLVHKKDSGNPQRFQLLRDMRRRYQFDGLSSLNYTVLSSELKRLYTWVLITVDEKAVLEPYTTRGKADTQLKAAPPQPPPVKKEQNDNQKKPGIPNTNSLRKDEQLKKNTGGGQPQRVQRKPLVAKRLVPQTIDWVPNEFNGSLPDYLNNFDYLSQPNTKVNAKTKQVHTHVQSVNHSVKSSDINVKNDSSQTSTNASRNTIDSMKGISIKITTLQNMATDRPKS